MFNEINGDFDDVAIGTFKVDLPTETSVRQLMDQIDKYKRVEEGQQSGKGKAKIIPQERKDFKLD